MFGGFLARFEMGPETDGDTTEGVGGREWLRKSRGLNGVAGVVKPAQGGLGFLGLLDLAEDLTELWPLRSRRGTPRFVNSSFSLPSLRGVSWLERSR